PILLLATPVVLWGGWPFFERGWASIVRRRLNMFTLIAIGTGTAYFYSVVATLLPGIFPAGFRGHQGEVAVYFEAAAVITTLVLVGQVLELRARSQTSGAIRALLGLAPKTARIVREDGSEQDVPLEHVRRGDLCGLGDGGSRTAPGLRPGERGSRADHCVPLRVGLGHADVYHGGNRPGSHCRRADQKRRGLRNAREGRHSGGG